MFRFDKVAQKNCPGSKSTGYQFKRIFLIILAEVYGSMALTGSGTTHFVCVCKTIPYSLQCHIPAGKIDKLTSWQDEENIKGDNTITE
jgi:hypothetical protein